MKAHFQKIIINEESSFIAKHLYLPRFDSEYHFHPEYELKYVIKSNGMRFVGDSVENFQEGDLVLIGPNIPHYWNSDPKYYKVNNLKVSAYLVMFSESCLGAEFFSLPEMASIKELLYNARGGICFTGANRSKIPIKMKRLVCNQGPLRIIMLLDILNDLLKSESHPLLTEEFVCEVPLVNNDNHSIKRLKKVHEYVMSNFQNKIQIQDVAEMANMSTHAFCKY